MPGSKGYYGISNIMKKLYQIYILKIESWNAVLDTRSSPTQINLCQIF